MNAMVLGAGRGTRLHNVGARVPKVLVDICGQPLLQRQLDYLAQQGVERVVVNAFHLADTVEGFADTYEGPIDLSVIVEHELLGTAGGVRNALTHLGSQPFFVLYGDVLVDEPLRPVLDAHLRSGASATITVYTSHETLGKGLVELDEHDLVVRFVEKGSRAAAPGLINAGLYVIDPAMLEQWPRGSVFDFGFDCFPALLERAEGIHAFRLARPVVDVGTPEGLASGRRVYGCG
jgi:NDP-sugar pyrophosphorylase family protein